MFSLILLFEVFLPIVFAESQNFGMVSIKSGSALQNQPIAGFDSSIYIDFSDTYYMNQTSIIDDEGYLSFSSGGYISLDCETNKFGVSDNKTNAVSGCFLAVLDNDTGFYELYQSGSDLSGITIGIMCFADGATASNYYPANMTTNSYNYTSNRSSTSTSSESTTLSTSMIFYNTSSDTSSNSRNGGSSMFITSPLVVLISLLF
ncbi:hypothetical protein ACO0SA_002358 [Hanseniaspora valbyensis]